MRERSMETSNTFANFTWLKAGQYAVVGLAIALGLSYIGPYGTYGYDPVWCAFFWVSVVMLGWVEGIFFNYASRGFTDRTRFSGWPTFLLSTALATIPIYFQALFLAEFVLSNSKQFLIERVSVERVLFFTIIGNLVQWSVIEKWPLFERSAFAISNTTEAPNPLADSQDNYVDQSHSNRHIVMDEMPKGLGGSILYIKVEDHYLRVVTTEGEGLVLRRMRDAVTELNDAQGLQVHRSWWVAKAAVDHVESRNRQKLLVLKDAQRVPISKTHLQRLKADGWV